MKRPRNSPGEDTRNPGKRESAISEIELHADAWDRFEKAVDKVAKSPPQHRTAKHPEKTKPAK
jgi:hypothetical protein